MDSQIRHLIPANSNVRGHRGLPQSSLRPSFPLDEIRSLAYRGRSSFNCFLCGTFACLLRFFLAEMSYQTIIMTNSHAFMAFLFSNGSDKLN